MDGRDRKYAQWGGVKPPYYDQLQTQVAQQQAGAAMPYGAAPGMNPRLGPRTMPMKPQAPTVSMPGTPQTMPYMGPVKDPNSQAVGIGQYEQQQIDYLNQIKNQMGGSPGRRNLGAGSPGMRPKGDGRDKANASKRVNQVFSMVR